MTVIELRGRINDEGKLEVDLPQGLPAGEVEVSIKFPEQPESSASWEERPWTEDEIRKAMTFGQARTGAEIAALLDETSDWWKQQGITDPVAWLEEVRRKERERRE